MLVRKHHRFQLPLIVTRHRRLILFVRPYVRDVLLHIHFFLQKILRLRNSTLLQELTISLLLLLPDSFQTATAAIAEPVLYSVPFRALNDQLVPLRHPSNIVIVYLEFISSVCVRRRD